MVGWSTVSRRVTALASTTIAHAARSGPSVMLLSEPLPWATARRRATGRFAPDSPLEEAVRSEPVSEKPNSLFFRENTGNFIVYRPASEDLRPKMQSGSIAYELNSLRAGTGN
jgi:hypothetical protein